MKTKTFFLIVCAIAIFLTTDKDFYHTIPFQFEKHCGIVIITLRQPNRHNIIQKVKYFLDHFNTCNMDSRIVLFKDNYYRIYD